MARKKVYGKCHICGAEGQLSFEHVPPQQANNDKTVKSYKALDVITIGNLPWEVKGLRAKIMQGGAGDHTLCISCNSFTGAKYVNDYIEAVNQTLYSGRLEVLKDNSRARIGLLNINPVSFAKEVLAMFASVNSPSFCAGHPEIKNLILDDKKSGIDMDKYGLFMYLYRGGTTRNSGFSVVGRRGGFDVVSEVTAFPFGFYLVHNPDRVNIPKYGTEITGIFRDNEYDAVGDYLFELPIQEQNGPLPFDFRTREEIEDAIKENEKYEKE